MYRMMQQEKLASCFSYWTGVPFWARPRALNHWSTEVPSRSRDSLQVKIIDIAETVENLPLAREMPPSYTRPRCESFERHSTLVIMKLKVNVFRPFKVPKIY